ncbi:MAG: hypothetical protein WBA57_05245 [Elainellaceae cyanobacterium]
MIQQQSHMAFVEPDSGLAASTQPFRYQPVDAARAELVSEAARLVYLDLEGLSCFETVDHQFEACGIVFENAIALKPSNPAFPPKSGETVLMGAPRAGMLEASFSRPVQFVSACLTSSRRAVMIAFDKNNEPLGETEIPGANLADGRSAYKPNMQLSLQASNIYRICVCSIGGQFTVDDIAFGF